MPRGCVRGRRRSGGNAGALLRRLWIIALVGWVSGCASFLPRLEAPKVTVASIEMMAVTPEGVTLNLLLDLDNGNPRDIRVDALDLSVAVGGVTVATARADESLLLPASGSGQARISAHSDFANWSSVLRQLAGKASLDYDIAGVAMINGRALPFSRRGELKTKAFFRKPS